MKGGSGWNTKPLSSHKRLRRGELEGRHSMDRSNCRAGRSPGEAGRDERGTDVTLVNISSSKDSTAGRDEHLCYLTGPWTRWRLAQRKNPFVGIKDVQQLVPRQLFVYRGGARVELWRRADWGWLLPETDAGPVTMETLALHRRVHRPHGCWKQTLFRPGLIPTPDL